MCALVSYSLTADGNVHLAVRGTGQTEQESSNDPPSITEEPLGESSDHSESPSTTPPQPMTEEQTEVCGLEEIAPPHPAKEDGYNSMAVGYCE